MALARWRRWTGLGWGLPHCMIGPPNFPSYNLSTCNLPHQRPQPSRFSHLLPSPSQLCDKPQSFSRDFFTSKQSRKTKAHPVSVPFQSGQSPSTQTPQRHSQPPFPKQTVPAPDGIDLAWSRDECRLASLSSLRPRASALPMPRYALLTLQLPAPCCTHLQTEVPCGSRARGRASALVQPNGGSWGRRPGLHAQPHR